MLTQFCERRLDCRDTEVEWNAVNIYPEWPVVEILGFGGAFTEATAWNYAQMNDEEKATVLRRYFDRESGAGYNLCRLHIGSCDFALSKYSLSKKPDLSDFSIERDRQYILPMVKDALKINPDIFFFASPWSPPAFMKTGGRLIAGGHLKEAFYDTYAQYFVKHLLAYREEGVNIRAVTVQNEPHAVQMWESCVFSAEQEAVFAVRHLRPALDAAGLCDVKILVWDHNKERLYERATQSMAVEGADRAIWGFGFHWYSGNHFDAIDLTRRAFPDKPVLETELCHCHGDSRNKTENERAIAYAVEYCENLRHGTAGICDWNMILSTKEGGPFHCRLDGGCYAPFCYGEKGLVEDAVFKVIEVFARSIERGDTVVQSTVFSGDIHAVAVKKQDGRLLVILVNTGKKLPVNLRVGGKVARFDLPADSVTANYLK